MFLRQEDIEVNYKESDAQLKTKSQEENRRIVRESSKSRLKWQVAVKKRRD